MKQSRAILGAIVGVAVVALLGYLVAGKSSHIGDKVRVSASFYPMAEFAKQVGGDRVAVTNLTPPGAEPHDFDPSPRDIAGVESSKVFVYNGAGLEAWAPRLVGDLRKNGVTVVEASRGVSLGTLPPAVAGSGESEAGMTDPHVWLDPVLAEREVEQIKQGLIAADPGGRSTYERNAANYEAELADLDRSFRSGLVSCQLHDIVTSHAAFGYLGKRYNLHMIAISGLSPDQEPSARELADVADYARSHGVRYIFFESLVSPKLADTIAHEVGAKTIAFNPLEGLTKEEIKSGKTYLTVQRANLAALRTALGCR